MELENVLDYEKILKDHEIMMVYFYSTWCPPCRMLRPVIEEYIENNPNNLILCVNTDNIKTIHKSYNINTVPTILCIKNSEIVDIIEGFIEYEEIDEMFIKLYQ